MVVLIKFPISLPGPLFFLCLLIITQQQEQQQIGILFSTGHYYVRLCFWFRRFINKSQCKMTLSLSVVFFISDKVPGSTLLSFLVFFSPSFSLFVLFVFLLLLFRNRIHSLFLKFVYTFFFFYFLIEEKRHNTIHLRNRSGWELNFRLIYKQ